MKEKIIKSLSATAVFLAASLFWGCSQDNPIEIENGYDYSINFMVDKLESDLEKTDYYKCESIYGEDRCNNFKEIFGSYDSEEIADTNYNDVGELIHPVSSSSQEILSSSSVTRYPYLLKNMNLKITLTSYQQVADTLSSADIVGDPEVRFAIKFFSDGIQVRMAETEDYTVSPVLLSEMNLMEWTGHSNVSVPITRGIDEIRLCPMVKNIDEDSDVLVPDDVDISSGECYTVTEIGLLEGPVTQSDSCDYYKMNWELELY
ncbi:MAG: hypothetical protein MJZ26_13940 [Fibrobacter sp.]|nr:hypothetical protein [Fibrobacter sp.]